MYDKGIIITSKEVESVEACAQFSLTNDEAQFWRFGKTTKTCWLQRSNNGKKSSERFISGNRECGNGE